MDKPFIRRLRSPLLLGLALLGCGSERSTEGLGPAHAQYVAARDATPQNGELTVRRFYEAYVEALRTRDAHKVRRFYRPDAEPEARAAIRMGAELATLLDSFSGEVVDVRYLGTRASLRAKETASFKFRNKPGNDSRERVYQLVRVGRDWYLNTPDLGAARKPR